MNCPYYKILQEHPGYEFRNCNAKCCTNVYWPQYLIEMGPQLVICNGEIDHCDLIQFLSKRVIEVQNYIKPIIKECQENENKLKEYGEIFVGIRPEKTMFTNIIYLLKELERKR